MNKYYLVKRIGYDQQFFKYSKSWGPEWVTPSHREPTKYKTLTEALKSYDTHQKRKEFIQVIEVYY